MAAAQGRGGEKDPRGLYATLSVPSDAEVTEIRKAYRRLALRWHPDKNPDNPQATAEFQKISGAYEVLSDSERREMYDTTGCIDAEELDEGGNLDHAADLFAAFFGGAGSTDLDPEEQAMLDEFLRIAGGGAFHHGGRRRKGRGGRGGSRGSRPTRASRGAEEALAEALFAAMASGPDGRGQALCCPQGHALKKRKADAKYACDLCNREVVEGKKFWDCRKCDHSLCQKCARAAEVEAAAQEDEDEEKEVLQEICEMFIAPERHGRGLRFRCNICKDLLETQDRAVAHVEESHQDEVRAVLEEVADDEDGRGMPFGGGFEEFVMASMMGDFLGGAGRGGAAGGRGAGTRARKRR